MASRKKTKSRNKYSRNIDDYYISQTDWRAFKAGKEYREAHFKSQTYYDKQNPHVQRIMREQNRPYQPTLATSVRRHILSRATSAIPAYQPVRFAISMFQPCKRAKTAERHNVFKKINRAGAGSIARRTMRRIKCQ